MPIGSRTARRGVLRVGGLARLHCEERVGRWSFLPSNWFAAYSELSSLGIVPSLWPVVGEITGHFGERLDPFSGEGAFHAGMDIASHYGDPVHATADGVVAGYGPARRLRAPGCNRSWIRRHYLVRPPTSLRSRRTPART